MIDSFSFVPPQQISISKSPQIELDNATKSNQSGNNFLTRTSTQLTEFR